jgi:ketosteroid isomerase-like protein
MTHPFYTTAEEAEEALYEAIAQANLDALMSIWADDEDIVCIHPTGQCMNGHTAIRESWRSIFASNPRFSVCVRGKVCWESALISAHCVAETLYLKKDRAAHGLMQSTNVFVRGTNGWRLASRHTSAAVEQAESRDEDNYGKRTLH